MTKRRRYGKRNDPSRLIYLAMLIPIIIVAGFTLAHVAADTAANLNALTLLETLMEALPQSVEPKLRTQVKKTAQRAKAIGR